MTVSLLPINAKNSACVNTEMNGTPSKGNRGSFKKPLKSRFHHKLLEMNAIV